jgi:hypothetical protein
MGVDVSPFFCLLFAGAAEVGARKEGSCRATPGKRVRRDKRNRATGERSSSKLNRREIRQKPATACDKFKQEQTAMLRDHPYITLSNSLLTSSAGIPLIQR